MTQRSMCKGTPLATSCTRSALGSQAMLLTVMFDYQPSGSASVLGRAPRGCSAGSWTVQGRKKRANGGTLRYSSFTTAVLETPRAPQHS